MVRMVVQLVWDRACSMVRATIDSPWRMRKSWANGRRHDVILEHGISGSQEGLHARLKSTGL